MFSDDEIKYINAIFQCAEESALHVCLFGGIAAQYYGSDRGITDIDIIVSSDSFAPLSHLPFLSIHSYEKASAGRIDVRTSPIHFTHSEGESSWFFDDQANDRLKVGIMDEFETKFISLEDKIVIKAILQRNESQGKFDLYDLKEMISLNKNNLDKSYIRMRADKCDSMERVKKCLGTYGVNI